MRLTLFVALFLASACANAGQPYGIALDNLKVVGTAASGSCGVAAVRITGVDTDNPHETKGLIAGTGGAIIVQSDKHGLTINEQGEGGIFLQDQNKLACATSPTGPKLVLALYCFARSCASVDYRVIDPATAKVVSKQNSDDECDASCAKKALGAALPVSLGDQL